MILKRFFSFCLFLLLVLFIQYIGYIFTIDSVDRWYFLLYKPKWTPPPWIFGPIWTILYLSIAIAGWLIFIKGRKSPKRKQAFVIYGIQLFLNLLWPYFFFFIKSPLLGALNILALLIAILINIILFLRIYRLSGFLLIPYFIWTLYATFLNITIWGLNR